MHEIDNVSYDAIYRYFNALSKFGYKSYGDVEKLIALLTHKTKIGFTTRITEDNVIRDTEDYRLRIEV